MIFTTLVGSYLSGQYTNDKNISTLSFILNRLYELITLLAILFEIIGISFNYLDNHLYNSTTTWFSFLNDLIDLVGESNSVSSSINSISKLYFLWFPIIFSISWNMRGFISYI